MIINSWIPRIFISGEIRLETGSVNKSGSCRGSFNTFRGWPGHPSKAVPFTGVIVPAKGNSSKYVSVWCKIVRNGQSHLDKIIEKNFEQYSPSEGGHWKIIQINNLTIAITQVPIYLQWPEFALIVPIT